MSRPERHPLEPLSATEVQTAVEILRKAERLTPTMRVVSISLREPLKEVVLNAAAGALIPREAFAVLFDNGSNRCYEAVLSLEEGRIADWKHVPGVQPTMTVDEQVECEQAVLASDEFKVGARKSVRH